MAGTAPEAPGEAPRQRVFFALWPDAAAAVDLERAAQAAQRLCGGRATRRETLHMTLAFIGEVDAERMARLREIAAGIAAPAFELRLDRLGWWRHNRILWAGASAVPQGLTLLAQTLIAALRDAGFQLDPRPFAAHLTLLRKAVCPAGFEAALGFQEVRWRAGEFMLMESTLRPQGPAYRPLAGFPLSSAD